MMWLHMDVHLLIVVPLKGHLVVAKDSLWLAKVTLQEDVWDSKVELVRWIIHENWGLRPVVVLDLEVGEEDDGGVGGEEDEDVPGAVQVGEAHTGPPGTKDSIVDPASDGHAPEDNTSSAKGENSNITFSFELKKEQGNRGNP